MSKQSLIWAVVAAISFLGATHLNAATVSGTVKFSGDAPKMQPMSMAADPQCAHAHSKPVLAETLVLGSGQTMGNVIVRVKSGLPAGKTYPTPSEPVVLDQKGCMYDPHVVAVQTGQTLKIKNSDKTLHNVHALPKVNSPFNLAMPQTMKEKDKKFRKAEDPFQIKCDVHPWMKSWILVSDHPYFMVTDKDGKFKIDGLPAGSYEIEAWHEKLGPKVSKVTVTQDGSQTVDFTFSR